MPAPWLRLRSDEQLVALFRSGSEDAFRAIHDRYRARLLVYTRQMLGGSRADAEDVLQDVFVRAYGALRASERPVSLRAWLYRIAHNRCIDHLRRPVPVSGELLELFPARDHDPPLVTERREQLRRLVVDVGRLPDQQRSALLMRELQGMSYVELAGALDVSVAAVKSLLVRARTGLVDAAEARDTACRSVQDELALACDRGVRCSGVARRHLRDCSSCRDYRDELRGVRRTFSALVPVGPIGMVWQCLVAGGGGGGGAGGAAAVGSGGGATTAGLGTAGTFVTSAKVALVCAAAAVTATGTFGVAGQDIVKAIVPGTAHRAHPARTVAPAGLTVVAPDGAVPVAVTGGTVAPLPIPDTGSSSDAAPPPSGASPRHRHLAAPLIIETVRDDPGPVVPATPTTPVNTVLSPANTIPLIGTSGSNAVTVTIGKGTVTTVSSSVSSSTTSTASGSGLPGTSGQTGVTGSGGAGATTGASDTAAGSSPGSGSSSAGASGGGTGDPSGSASTAASGTASDGGSPSDSGSPGASAGGAATSGGGTSGATSGPDSGPASSATTGGVAAGS